MAAAAGTAPLVADPRAGGTGRAGRGLPFPWGVYRWIEGRPYEPDRDDEVRAAQDLARFVLALREIDTAGAPPTGRAPLEQLQGTREALEASQKEIDTPAALAAWERALDAPPWDGRPVWIHNDLLPPNLVDGENGHLTAVIDFGTPAWAIRRPTWCRRGACSALPAARRTVPPSPSTTPPWDRARGYALHQAALIIPYYRVTNPGFVTMAVRTVGQVVGDSEG